MVKGFTLVPVLALSAMALLSGCAENGTAYNSPTQYIGDVAKNIKNRIQGNADGTSYWDGDEMKGPPSIVIHLDEQKAYFYKGKQLAGVSAISTGREGFDTPTGSFHIIQKDKDHVSSRYGNYIDANGAIVANQIDTTVTPKPKGTTYDGDEMPYFMRIVGGTGLHEGYLPGYPASHGCIRMPGFMAENFFYNVSVGTPVTIVR